MTDERDVNPVATEAVPVDHTAPFRSALMWVAAAWAVGAVIVGGACLLSPAASPFDPLAAAVITIGSGLVAGGAVFAGALLHRSLSPPPCLGDSKPASNPAATLLASAVAVMSLRLVGTVALFLTCRYHLAASVEVVGSMTVGWYLYLTTVEVAAVAHESKRIDHAPGQACRPSVIAIKGPTHSAERRTTPSTHVSEQTIQPQPSPSG